LVTEDPIMESTTLRAARDRYFDDNGFGADGGYGDAWVDFKLGPVPFPFPNTAPRVAAVRFHDLHHLLTGYATDLRGELEISGWELGAGCRWMIAAWQLNLAGVALGVFLYPRRVFAAFVRGRRSGGSFYGMDYDALLGWTVGEARARMAVPADAGRARASDLFWFVLCVLAGVPVLALSFVLGVPFLPIAWAARALARRRR
jgi:hypothetical protein